LCSTNPQSKLRVALISGGRSGEHEISLRSAASVREALDRSRYDLIEYFIDPAGKWHPAPISADFEGNPGVDVVFPVLHGTFGEDGTVQGLLELAGLPYVGAGVLASSAAMDKVVTKRLCREAGLPVVEYVVLDRNAARHAGWDVPFAYPVFVKPANLGSSVGISKVDSKADLEKAIATAAQFDRKIVIERGVKGREFECAVLGGEPARASVPCEVIPSEEFYSYEDKYILNAARTELPPQLSEAKTAEMQRLALAAFEAVGCEGMARVDFLMDGETQQLYVNEINTIPGFTSISMYPKMWAYSGLPFSDLIDRLIALALERSEQKRQTRFAR
jgi:D-alanine-D-alanine ligase